MSTHGIGVGAVKTRLVIAVTAILAALAVIAGVNAMTAHHDAHPAAQMLQTG